MTGYFVRCLRGAEGIAAVEVAERAAATVTAIGHREVRFRSGASQATLLDLRTVDDVFARVTTLDGIGHTRAELARIARAMAAADLGAATIDARPGPDAAAELEIEVVGSFLGRRNFNRFELEDALGPALAVAAGGRYVSRAAGAPVAADVTFRAHLDGEELVVGRRLGARPLHRRAYKSSSGPGSLHPPLAAAMVWLAGIEPGVRLLDPFCGAGTILAEARRWEPTSRVIGLDAAAAALDHARANTGGLPLVRADAADPPLRAGAFDRLVTNPPWGGQAPVLGRAGTDAVVHVAGHVLATGGRSAVLVDESSEDAVRWAAEPALRLVTSLFGRHPRLLVLGGDTPLLERVRQATATAAAAERP